jgi:hypothetical protein
MPAGGLYTGHREIPKLTPELLDSVLDGGARWLAGSIRGNGRYVYGLLPCFDRRLTSYNALRHASSTYALLDCLEYLQKEELKAPAERAVDYMVRELIREYEPAPGGKAAFLVDGPSREIRLGGNGLALLVLCKWRELTGTDEHLPLLKLLGQGLEFMRRGEGGGFVHVLHSEDLSLKEKSRVIYYDGEAVFGLLRLYGASGAARWLEAARKAFDSFLDDEHSRAHDHWLSYSANEITLHLPEERYFGFGLNNCLGHLDFVLRRETSYPTLLELMMAAQRMLTRLRGLPEFSALAGGADLEKFKAALHYRAHYLLHGFFWPETAMFFQRPESVVSTFFIRHHGFRTRIDDVQHFLSGLIAYNRLLKEGDPEWAAPERLPVPGGSAAQS